mmetsp:Transcript_48852/g.153433  ORF Transcript_48852/g.153433 Transcript_48852/m.153433 type:complete len:83 (-) Transcript_48852:621-869(-)
MIHPTGRRRPGGAGGTRDQERRKKRRRSESLSDLRLVRIDDMEIVLRLSEKQVEMITDRVGLQVRSCPAEPARLIPSCSRSG